MKPLYKLMLREFLARGFVFAVVVGLFDYFSDQPFSLFKFAFNFSFFGIFMALLAAYKFKKSQPSKQID